MAKLTVLAWARSTVNVVSANGQLAKLALPTLLLFNTVSRMGGISYLISWCGGFGIVDEHS